MVLRICLNSASSAHTYRLQSETGKIWPMTHDSSSGLLPVVRHSNSQIHRRRFMTTPTIGYMNFNSIEDVRDLTWSGSTSNKVKRHIPTSVLILCAHLAFDFQRRDFRSHIRKWILVENLRMLLVHSSSHMHGEYSVLQKKLCNHQFLLSKFILVMQALVCIVALCSVKRKAWENSAWSGTERAA